MNLIVIIWEHENTILNFSLNSKHALKFLLKYALISFKIMSAKSSN